MLKYLARYTHRVAIGNHRLTALESDGVEFLWKDYAHQNKRKTMRLKPVEFIRRFLLHVLPGGFVRLRHYGFLASRVCREKLGRCRALLGVATAPKSIAIELVPDSKGDVERDPAAHACPVCREGRMVIIDVVLPAPLNHTVGPEHWRYHEPAPFNTS